ncbi:hypothetical protein OUA97_13010 [Phenylobacterium sp. 58.2.17]|nr:hypothetical protein [Phenylobacterium sp. 58.2.17]MCX7587310.1 hypothetical protein [Phenylobacterium sp. 58.2.17]
MRLHSVEDLLVDQRGNGDGDDLVIRLERLGLATPIKLVTAHIGGSGQQPMDLARPPAPTVGREDASTVQVAGDRLDAHRAGGPIPLQCKTENPPDGVGVQRIDLQLLLDLCSARFGRDRPIADRRIGTVPEPLAGIFLQSPERVLAVLFRLVLVE